MAELFDASRSTVTYHINKIFNEEELDRDTSVENFDGSKELTHRPPFYYNLDVIIFLIKRLTIPTAFSYLFRLGYIVNSLGMEWIKERKSFGEGT